MVNNRHVRLGNLVLEHYYTGGVYSPRIVEVSCDNILYLDDGYDYIPLTEEWLLKLGFNTNTYKPGYIGIDVQHTDFVLEMPVDGSEDVSKQKFAILLKYGGWTWFKQFDYVHEIQNFFFAFYGEELTLKNNSYKIMQLSEIIKNKVLSSIDGYAMGAESLTKKEQKMYENGMIFAIDDVFPSEMEKFLNWFKQKSRYYPDQEGFYTRSMQFTLKLTFKEVYQEYLTWRAANDK